MLLNGWAKYLTGSEHVRRARVFPFFQAIMLEMGAYRKHDWDTASHRLGPVHLRLGAEEEIFLAVRGLP